MDATFSGLSKAQSLEVKNLELAEENAGERAIVVAGGSKKNL